MGVLAADAKCGDNGALGALLPNFWEGLSESFQFKNRRFEGLSHAMLYISLEEKCEVAT